MRLGELLRAYRDRAKVSQEELADRAGVSVRTLRGIEQGSITRPQARSVRRLVEAAGLDPALLQAHGAPAETPAVRIDVLGPLTVRVRGRALDLRSEMQRRLLGLLALHGGSVVTQAEIVDYLWGEQIPASYANLVHTYVSRLRAFFARHGVTTFPVVLAPAGYRLVLAPGQSDLLEFTDLMARAKAHREAGEAEEAEAAYARALALWRGEVLADLPQSHPVAVTLSRQRLRAALEHADLALRAGRYHPALEQLRVLAEAEPLHEGLHARIMLALAGLGEQAAALRMFQELRGKLADVLGVEPGAELQDAYLAVLRQDARPGSREESSEEQGWPEVRAAQPRQLPPDIAHFTGRAEQLATLDEALSAAGGHDLRPVVISGSGGVGKTSLAVHWAHRVKGHFPDGQLYVNLRGFGSDDPMEPAAALEMLLRAAGVPAQQLPAGTDERSALLRTVLADRRVLILLDNARDEAQVRPLLTGAGSMTLITSRNQLQGLAVRDGAHRVTVDVLAPDETRALLTSLLSESRIGADAQSVAELGDLCAHLPLALRIAAANIDADPYLKLTDYLTDLRQGNRLAALEIVDDEQAAVRATFDLSYTALPESERRMFRLLGLFPGTDFTVAATAALAGCTPVETLRRLRRLASFHLIDSNGPGRYGFHDLLHLYAAEKAHATEDPEEVESATRRLREWYLHSALAAAETLYKHWVRLPPPPPSDEVTPMSFAAGEDAVAWLESEHANLIAMIHHNVRHGPAETVWLLTDALRGHFWSTRPLDDWFACAGAALDLAESAGNLAAQAVFLRSVADALTFQNRGDQAISLYERSRDLTRRLEWWRCHTSVLAGLAHACFRLGRPQDAAEHLEEAIAISEKHLPADVAEAHYSNLCVVYHQLGRLEAAYGHLRRVRAAFPARPAAACTLGEVCHSLGRLDEAVTYLHEAVSLNRQQGDRGGELESLVLLAAVHRDLGHYEEAVTLASDVLRLCPDIRDPLIETNALNVLGQAHEMRGRTAEASLLHQRALGVARASGNRYAEVVSLIGLAHAGTGLGRFTEAAAYAKQARTIAHDRCMRVLEGQALHALARTLLAGAPTSGDAAAGDPAVGDAVSEAADLAARAMRLHRETGHRLGEEAARRLLDEARERTARMRG
ncbi:BTAD domain-containing putative transcriptional regulator [Nonomuraea sp. NPDC050783]|uniref:BTAD domain-containing putative transcriptional regulator n=1 Tax=Nonomuraea sp. NPDC050783 TaxID=3154634 RepID=UPI0034670CE8